MQTRTVQLSFEQIDALVDALKSSGAADCLAEDPTRYMLLETLVSLKDDPDEEFTFLQHVRIVELRSHLRKERAGHAALVEDYIGEAEHQDGIGYWLVFSDMGAVLEDFDVYAAEFGGE